MNHIKILVIFFGLASMVLSGAKVTRADDGVFFPLDQAERRIVAALGEKELGKYLDVQAVRYRIGASGKLYTLAQLQRLEFTSAEVSLAALDYDAAGRFSAVLRAAQSDSEIVAQGRFEQMEQIPTLRRTVGKGGVISREDVVRMGVPARRIKRGVIGEEDGVVGFSAVRTIYPGRPIRAEDVAKPAVVEKGAAVKLTYRKSYMELQDLGEALEQGAIGNVIRVRNVSSGKVVAARVEGPGEALVNFTQVQEISGLAQEEGIK